MGEAKRRGTFDERLALAIARDAAKAKVVASQRMHTNQLPPRRRRYLNGPSLVSAALASMTIPQPKSP